MKRLFKKAIDVLDNKRGDGYIDVAVKMIIAVVIGALLLGVIETEVTETWAVYTISYNGEEYFADHVFGLSEEQKRLAEDYTSNLNLFLSDDTFN